MKTLRAISFAHEARQTGKWPIVLIATAALALSASILGCSSGTAGNDSPLVPTAVALLRFGSNGAPDNSMGGSGVVTTRLPEAISQSNSDAATSAAIQPDGKILVAAYSGVTFDGPSSALGKTALLRYGSDGTLDSTFGSGGIVRTALAQGDAGVSAMTVQPDGKIVLAGTTFTSFSPTSFFLVRYMPDGTLDTSLGGGQGIVSTAGGKGCDTAANALALQADQKIVVVGCGVLRYNADGTPDSSFGSAGFVGGLEGKAVVIQSDGKIVITGPAEPNNVLVARLNPDGTLDSGFGSGGKASTPVGPFPSPIGGNLPISGNAVTVQPDGKIVVVGGSGRVIVARYNPDGTLDAGFGIGGIVITGVSSIGVDRGNAMVMQADGKIVVTGGSSVNLGQIAGEPFNEFVFLLVRYNSNGTLDSTFGVGGVVTRSASGPSVAAEAVAIALEPDGSIVVAGHD